MQYRSSLTLQFAAAVVASTFLSKGIAVGAPKQGFNPAQKLSAVPGIKPKYVMTLDIEKYLKDGERKPRWTNGVIPVILSASDVSRYRVIFRVQREGDWGLADRIILSLENSILMGHVLAKRYLHPNKYRTKYGELKAWMEKYADHPEAVQMYKLALKRRPVNWTFPKPPTLKYGVKNASRGQRSGNLVYSRAKKLSRVERREVLGYERRLRHYLRKGWTLAFKNLIGQKRVKNLFHPWQLDKARARLAAGYYAAGRDDWAFNWASKAIKRSGKYLPEAHWTAGLAAWRLGKFKVARDQFKLVFSSSYASSWLISAGAFWASRATIKMRRPQDFSKYLQVAAEYPRTFYGILASHILGKKVEYNWTPPPLAKEIVAELAAAPGGRRAVTLIQVGEDRLAERELRIIFSTAKPELARAMLAIADRAEMPSLAMRLGTMLVGSGSTLYDSTAYPAPTLKMGTKEFIDRELILAIVRQESGFNPKAKSPRGARGLMQLMPGTASFVARDRRYSGSKRKSLFDPGTNITLGQRYIDILLKDKGIKGNLFRMVTAWNAGPGNLIKWNRKVKHNNDPLLFIESIPSKETRIFIERVVANYWIYRGRFNQSTNTLGELAAGNWPIYHSERLDAVELAEGTPK